MTAPDRVVIVSGSRAWRNEAAVSLALEHQLLVARRDGVDLIVRHGVCEAGADLYAALWLRSVWNRDDHGIWQAESGRLVGVFEDPCPADFPRYGISAGHIRNRGMARKDPKACLVLAFTVRWMPTEGTASMLTAAFAAGIPCRLEVDQTAAARPADLWDGTTTERTTP